MRFRWRSMVVGAFVVGAAYSFVFAVASHGHFAAPASSDFLGFHQPVALNVLHGHGLINAQGQAAVEHPPGYPLVLAGVFWIARALGMSRSLALQLFSGMANGTSAALLVLLGRRLFDRRVGLLAAVLFLTYPLAVYLLKQPPTSEIVFTPSLFLMMLVLLWALDRSPVPLLGMLVVGMLLGWLDLIRPAALLLVIPVGLAVWYWRAEVEWRRRLGLVAAVLIGLAVAVGPWEAWMRARTGRFIVLSEAGAVTALEGLTFAQGNGGPDRIALPGPVAHLRERAIAARDRGQMRTTGQVAHFLVQEGVHDPAGVVELLGLKAVQSFYSTESRSLDTAVGLVQLVYGALIVAGAALAWRRHRRCVLLLAGVTAAFWVAAIGGLSIARITEPALALLQLLAAIALAQALSRWRGQGAADDGDVGPAVLRLTSTRSVR